MEIAKTHYNKGAKYKYKNMKNDFQQKIVWILKGIIKEQAKEQRL